VKEALLPVAVVAATWVAVAVVLGMFFRRLGRRGREGAVPPLIRRVLVGVVWVFSLIVILKFFYPDLNLTGLVIGSTVFSAIIGLALQDILINFLAGVVFSVEKPFRINDWVMVGGQEGVVTEISWRTTKVRTRENNLAVIPNSVIARQEITNYDYPSPLHRRSVRVGVDYRHPPLLVRQALLEASRAVSDVLDSPPPDVHLLDFGDFSITYELRYWLANYDLVPETASRLRIEIYETFRRMGIRIPFPIRTVRVGREPAPAGVPRLTVVSGAQAGEEFTIGEEALIIGRQEGNPIRLADSRVSKEHARVVGGEEGLHLEDLESRTGTRVNGRPVRHWRLQPGDEIEMGGTRMVFRCD